MKRLLICVFLPLLAPAQTHTEPPAMVQIVRRPGTDGSGMQRYAAAQATITVFGMTAVTGPSETWHIEAHNSFASIEDMHEAVRAGTPARPPDSTEQLSGDVLAASKTLIAVYRPGLSYRPDQAIRMFSKARYFQVSIYRIRPGTEAGFAEVLKLRKDNLDSINLDRPDIAYQVISGAPSGTFLLLAPLTSLRSLDEALANARGYADSASKTGKLSSDIEISRSHLLFRVEPGLSQVSDEFAAEALEFWRGRSKEQ